MVRKYVRESTELIVREKKKLRVLNLKNHLAYAGKMAQMTPEVISVPLGCSHFKHTNAQDEALPCSEQP